MHFLEGLTIGESQFAFIFVGNSLRVAILASLGVFGIAISAVARRHERLVLGVGASKTYSRTHAHLFDGCILHIELFGERDGTTIGIAVLGCIIQRVRCLEIIVIFEPLLHFAVVIVFSVIRIGIGIIHKCHCGVARRGVGKRHLVAEVQFIESIGQVDVTTYNLTLRFFHNALYAVIGHTYTKSIGALTTLGIQRVSVIHTHLQWLCEPIGVHSALHIGKTVVIYAVEFHFGCGA